MEDYYGTLGVSPRSSADEIRERYRFLAQAYHPDKFPDPRNKERAEAEFKRVQEAYQVLSSPVRRSAYDARRGTRPGPDRRPREGESPGKPSRRRATVSFWRQRVLGLSGARWVVVFLFFLDLVVRDPLPFADELLLLVLFFTIDKLIALFPA